ncbi:MAG: M48 family metalloprotease [Luminiphilus sp.]|nr:M48 family metalloprotease [Luminiphilus sp.]
MKRLIAAVFITTLLASCAGSSTVTVGGRPVSMPKKAADEHEKLIENVGIYDDPELAAYVNEIGARLVSTSSMPDQAFTFTLLDSPDINAFALPGGLIYINRGLLAYLDSEAELAGVIAHEIGHITERHHARRKTQTITNQVAAVSALILTGSGDLYDAANMYGAELISGFGRDMELEADAAGAEFMHKSGYDADALLSVIGVLKDQERYQKAVAKASGRPPGTYHGLYASHPRNDLRLQTVIKTANTLDLDAMSENPELPGRFRRETDGMVIGASAEAQSDPLRYYHNKLDFTFEHPEGWTVSATTREIIARAPDTDAMLTIKIAKIDPNTTPEVALPSLASGDVNEQEIFESQGLQGATGLATAAGNQKRLGVVDHRFRYLFEGEAGDFNAADSAFKTIITSFRPLFPKEKKRGESHVLNYVQVPRGATFDSLSSGIRVPDAENQLRLINGYYPSGEPRTGDWLKVLR